MPVKTKRQRVAELPEIIPPTTDVMFKILFGNERNKDITADFLSSVLEVRVTEEGITFLDPHLRRSRANAKLGILDIILKLEDGQILNLEMQVGNLDYIFNRVEYYISNMTARQLKRSQKFHKLLPVVSIMVFKETVLPNTKRFHCEFEMLEKHEHFALHSLRAFHTLELSKLPEGGGKLVDWLRFINSEKKEDFMAVAQKSKPMQRAMEVLEEASADQNIRDEYWYQVIAEADKMARDDFYLKRGKAEGIAEGIAKTAKAMKAKGMDTAIIAEITGLPEDDIRQL